MSLCSNFCPLFVIWVGQNWLKNWGTRTSQYLDLIFFSIPHLVTLHLDKCWTFSGFAEVQSLYNICPSYRILARHIISQYLWLVQILDKSSTNTGQILVHKTSLVDLPFASPFTPWTKFGLEQTLDKPWTCPHWDPQVGNKWASSGP